MSDSNNKDSYNLPWEVSKSGNILFQTCIIKPDGGSVAHMTNWSTAKRDTDFIVQACNTYHERDELIKEMSTAISMVKCLIENDFASDDYDKVMEMLLDVREKATDIVKC